MQKKLSFFINHWIIFSVILIFLLFNLFFSLSSQYPENDGSYNNLRNIESISKQGKPLYKDILSYSGRENIFPSMYHYIMSLPYFLGGIPLIKIFQAIFASLTGLFVYLIVYELTERKKAAFSASLISLFLPVYSDAVTNTINPISLAVPLATIMFYSFIKTNKAVSGKKQKTHIIRNYSLLFAFSAILLPLVSADSFIILASFFIYAFIMRFENTRFQRIEAEMIIFAFLSTLWLGSIIFKNALIMHGPLIIWQNIPESIISIHFSPLTIIKIISSIGLLTFLCGLYIIYRNIFKEKNKSIYLFLSLILTTSLFLVFRIIMLDKGLIYFGLCFSIFVGYFIKEMEDYLVIVKTYGLRNIIAGLGIFIIILSVIIPGIYAMSGNNSINKDTVESLIWIKNNTPKDSVIASTVQEGELITYFSSRKNVADTNYLMVNDVNSRFKAIDTIFRSSSTVKAIASAQRYDVDYIYLDKAYEKYNISDSLRYSDTGCIEKVYPSNISTTKIKIYSIKCRLEEYE